MSGSVETLQERFFWLGQHRPVLGMPERFMFFMWPHSIRYLEESGVWEKIQRRIVGSGFYGAGETVEAALRDLTAREYRSTCQAIRGDGYRNLFEGDRVEYELIDRGKGPQAQNVEPRRQ